MSDAKSHDEIVQEYKTAMGGELGSVFSALSDELVWLHWRWKQYRTLFGEKFSRIEMLNDAAPLCQR